ncbi:MAG: FtsW/RodA/SpoVE family cell cycle protein, partial [Patescibacteria group bacterium]
ISFQPAELAKLAFIIYLSAFFSKKKAFLPFAVLTCVLVALIMLQPDLGTAVILTVSGLIIYFVSGASIVLLAGVSLVGFASALVMILLSSYRKQRLLTFFNPDKDPLGASYHLRQILLALGSGGLFGLGLGQSRQKYNYLPAATTDSIFAVIAEEVGFIGAAVVIIAFLFYIYKALMIAKQAPDKFGMLLAVGIASWIGVQALINLAVIVSLVPLTGTPLPFISYGGSSLVLVLAASGILVNISRQKVIRK